MAVDVLQAKIRKLKNPTMVCICPTIRELPLHIKEEARHKYGQARRRMLTGRSRSAFSTRSRKRFRQ